MHYCTKSFYLPLLFILGFVGAAPQSLMMPASAAEKTLTERAADLLRDIHPSFLGAIGTGEELARNAPVIMDHLRATRAAIEEDIGGFGSEKPIDETKPYAAIKDPTDRAKLAKDLEDLQYLMEVLQTERLAGGEAAMREPAQAIEQKIDDINALFLKWTGQLAHSTLERDTNRPWSDIRGEKLSSNAQPQACLITHTLPQV